MALKQGYVELSEDDYHKNPDNEALSASDIKLLLSRSPRHLQVDKINRYDTTQQEEISPQKAENLLFGRAVHSMILQPDLKEVVEGPDLPKNTKAGKDAWALAEANNPGKIILKKKLYDKSIAMHNSVWAHAQCKMFLEKGQAEISGFFQHVRKFWCKFRPDFLVDDLEAIIDLKTTTDARQTAFSRQCFDLGYDISAAFYIEGNKYITLKNYTYWFIAVEKDPPYPVQIYYAVPEMIAAGGKKCMKAYDLFEQYCKGDEWPLYTTKDKMASLWPYTDDLLEVVVPNWEKY